jgi:Uma2 family endonuclease
VWWAVAGQQDRDRVDPRFLRTGDRLVSTTAFDRGDKLDAYQRLPALREYLLLDSRDPRAALYWHTDQGAWQRISVLEGADLLLESVNVRLPLSRSAA